MSVTSNHTSYSLVPSLHIHILWFTHRYMTEKEWKIAINTWARLLDAQVGLDQRRFKIPSALDPCSRPSARGMGSSCEEDTVALDEDWMMCCIMGQQLWLGWRSSICYRLRLWDWVVGLLFLHFRWGSALTTEAQTTPQYWVNVQGAPRRPNSWRALFGDVKG